MSASRLIVFFVFLMLFAPGVTIAKPMSNQSAFMPLYGETAPIESHVKFCLRMPEECDAPDKVAERMHLDAARLTGVRAGRIYALTFGLGAAFAGAAGT